MNVEWIELVVLTSESEEAFDVDTPNIATYEEITYTCNRNYIMTHTKIEPRMHS